MKKHFTITPRVVAKFLSAIVGLLLVINLLFLFIEHVLKLHFHSIHIFYLNSEGNVPTLYSCFAILTAAVLLWLIGDNDREKGLKRYWKFLSCMFVFLAIDELMSIHETLTDNMQELLGEYAAGALHFAWVIPYMLVFGVVFIFMIRFLILLPSTTRKFFLVAGFVFVLGAIGLEMVGGRFVYFHGEASRHGLPYALITTLEELLEMVAIVIFIYALSGYYLSGLASRSVLLTAEITTRERNIANASVRKNPEVVSVNEDSVMKGGENVIIQP